MAYLVAARLFVAVEQPKIVGHLANQHFKQPSSHQRCDQMEWSWLKYNSKRKNFNNFDKPLLWRTVPCLAHSGGGILLRTVLLLLYSSPTLGASFLIELPKAKYALLGRRNNRTRSTCFFVRNIAIYCLKSLIHGENPKMWLETTKESLTFFIGSLWNTFSSFSFRLVSVILNVQFSHRK